MADAAGEKNAPVYDADWGDSARAGVMSQTAFPRYVVIGFSQFFYSAKKAIQ